MKLTPEDHATYKDRCRQRWYDEPLRDALRNWRAYQAIHDTLVDALKRFHADPQLEDAGGKRHNPEGTLTAYLWQLQTGLQPDPHRIDPLLDFCEHYQKIHLRRGLLIYCELILRKLEAQPQTPEPELLHLTAA